jgi:hypothetical protein
MAKKWSQKTFPINTDALRAELSKRGLTLAGASREMGHSESYINSKMFLGYIHENDAKMLELMFHIPRSAYEIVEPEPIVEVEEVAEETPAVVQNIEANIDYDKLYQTIYSAVFTAVKEAFK